MIKILLLFTIINTSICYSQEKKDEEKKWSGNFDLGLNFTKNIEETFQFNNLFKLNYKTKRHKASINNSIAFISNTGQDQLLNKGIQDLKYDLITKNLNISLSFQHLYDVSKRIKKRFTSGIGLTYNFFKKKHVEIGISVQREKESILNGDNKLQRRLNSNFIFTKKINDTVDISLKNSYQPNLKSFGDFRCVSNLYLRLNLNSNFLLSFNTTYNYDSKPELGIPESDYQLINSISYSF